MSGFAAVFSVRPGQTVDRGEVEALARAYTALRGTAPGATLEAGSLGHAVAFPAPGRHPDRVVEDPSGWAVTVGFAHGFTTPGTFRAEELDGQFALLAYRREAGEVLFCADPVGHQPAYAARRADRLYCSTSLLALARHLRAAPNEIGLLNFLRVGFQYGAQTGWEGIEHLTNATELRVNAAGLSERTYWRPEPLPELRAMSLQEAAENVADVTVDAFRRRWGSVDAALMADLTGGYDSRMMTSALDRAGVSFSTNTAGPPDSADARIAQAIARTAGWRWQLYGLPDDWAQTCDPWVDAAVHWGDGHLQALQLAGVLRMHQDRAPTQDRLFVGGGWETFREHSWIHQPFVAGRSNTVDLQAWIDFRVLGNLDLTVFRSDPSEAIRRDATERLTRFLEPWEGQVNTVQLDALDWMFATGHFGAYAGAARGFIDQEIPGYLKPIWTRASSVHHNHRRLHRMQASVITKLRPDLARIETTDGGPAEPLRLANAHRFVPCLAQRGFRSGRKKLEIALGRPLRRTPPPTGTDPQALARVATIRRLGLDTPAGRSGMRSARLYDLERLGRLCDGAPALAGVQGATLARVLTVELSLRAADAGL